MDAFASTDREMILAMRADFEVFVEFLVKHHRAALWTLGPKALGNLAFLGFAELGLFGERRVAGRGWRRDSRFSRFEGERLLAE